MPIIGTTRVAAEVAGDADGGEATRSLTGTVTISTVGRSMGYRTTACFPRD